MDNDLNLDIEIDSNTCADNDNNQNNKDTQNSNNNEQIKSDNKSFNSNSEIKNVPNSMIVDPETYKNLPSNEKKKVAKKMFKSMKDEGKLTRPPQEALNMMKFKMEKELYDAMIEVLDDSNVNNSEDIIIDEETTNNSHSSNINSNNSKINSKQVVSWREEAIKGNFMPAIVMLQRKQINVEEIVNPNTEERLIHLAVTYSFLNVSKCLIEKFGANVNSKNKQGHTPLHIIANNSTKDIFLLSYFLNTNNIDINSLDNTKVTPLFYSIMNGFNEGMMAFISINAKLDNIDSFGNTCDYIALIKDNKFAFKFLSNHSKSFNINACYYNNTSTLSEVLITSNANSLAKHILKNFTKCLNINSLIDSSKNKDTFQRVNYLVYELCNATFIYKRFGSIFGLFNLLTNLRKMKYKTYVLSFMIYDLIISYMNKFVKYLTIIFVITIKCLWFYNLYSEYVGIESKYKESYDNYFNELSTLIILLFTISCLIIGFIKILFIWIMNLIKNINNSNESNNNIYNPDSIEKQLINSDNHYNIINQYRNTSENNTLNTPMISDICEVCLINKEINNNHCNSCNVCVKNYHFHSKLLDICVSKTTVTYYLMFIISIANICFGIIYCLYHIQNKLYLINEKDNIYNTLYISDNSWFNFFIFLYYLSKFKLILVILLFLIAVHLYQIAICICFSFGYNSTYYYLWRLHKPHNSLNYRSRDNKNSVVTVPHGNTINIINFFKNIIISNN